MGLGSLSAQGPVLHFCGPFSRILVTGTVSNSAWHSSCPGRKCMELCCNSSLHQRCVGQAGSGASGQEKALGGVTDLASCLLPLPAPCSGEVRVFCCSSQIHPDSLGPSLSPGFVHSQWVAVPISPDVLGGCSQGEVEHGVLMSGAPRDASCALPPRSAPLPCCEGEGGHMDTSCGPASAPHPHTPKRGSLSE